MPLVYVPAGCFIMGNNENYNERPAHEVCLSAFWIGQMEVTNAQYAQCVEDGNCERPSGNVSQYSDPAYADYPVVAVTWQNALNFARWFGGSLPTEAQWEYAARGPMSYVYPWGNARPNDIRANFGVSGLMPADSHHEGASWVGALNMAGNAFEWVFDWYDFQYYAVPEANSTNPTGPQDGLERVIRGGSCSDDEWHIRSAYRGYLTPNSVDPRIGFRVVMPANQ
jgi:formylglycine-generating enzyme required for sulfatase activity